MSEHPSTRRFAAAAYVPPSRLRRLIGWNTLGIIIVLVAVGISLNNVLSIRAQYSAPHKRVVRVMHWQLELGYRDALQQVIDSYNELQRQRYEAGTSKTQIEVVQLPVTEKVFSQVLKVNLIAGTAPDIFTHLGNVELSRDCAAIDQYIEQPNPYNAPEFLAGEVTDPALAKALATMPWRDTYIDSMQGGFNRERQTQYGIGVSFTLGGRFAYNLDLIREITGAGHIPTTTGELLALGRKTREFAQRSGQQLWPIAASRYNSGYFTNDLASIMLQPWRRILDTNRDGDVSDTEGWAGMASGTIGLRDPIFGQYLDVAEAISQQFSTGFSSMDRDGGMYLFVQQKAPVFFCASWDAGTVIKLAQGRFQATFGSIPVPGPGEPWNDPPRQPTSEAGIVSWGAYHLNRDGKVPESIDFMRYWTSYAVNQRFNRAADWIPAIIGTSPSSEMAAFAPRIAGVPGAWSPGSTGGNARSGRTGLTLQGQMADLTTGEITKERLIERSLETYNDPNYGASLIWSKDFVETRNAARQQERAVGILAAAALAESKRLPATVTRDLLWGQIPLYDGQCVRWMHQRTLGTSRSDGKPAEPFPEVDP